MKASEAFLAWCDGEPVEVSSAGGWHHVHRFELDIGLQVRVHNGITEVRGFACRFDYRIREDKP